MSREVPPSVEVQVERIRRKAAGLSPWLLDMEIAVATTRRDVAAAHRRHAAAAVWHELALALADVRAARVQAAREIEDMVGPPPPVMRPLTDAELAESWPDADTPQQDPPA